MSLTTPFQPQHTRKQALTLFRKALTNAGIETAGLDARLLLAHALTLSAHDLLIHDALTLGAEGAIAATKFLEQRLAGLSVARIIGYREFWGLKFYLSEATLEPRPDTETLIEAVLETFLDKQAPLRILDLGTGTGCILISLLKEFPNASGAGVDIAPGALEIARKNSEFNGVSKRCSFISSNWFEQVDGQFDLIVSNPPYIRSAVIPTLDTEVRAFDPLLALDGGADGLDSYRLILSSVGQHLTPSGRVFLEIGFDQEQKLKDNAKKYGFRPVSCRHDVAGNPRVIELSEGK